MLTIDDIPIDRVIELRKYKQPPVGNYACVTLIRGDSFYARCVSDSLQEWTSGYPTVKNVQSMSDEAVKFEEQLGSKLL